MGKFIVYALCALLSLLLGCAAIQNYDMQEKSLRRLSNAVQGVWWGGENLSENKILQSIAETDKSLLAHFGKNSIRIFIVSGEPIVLICTPDNQQALFEDVACTAQIETRRYEHPSPCEPLLDPLDYCKRK